MNKNLFEYISSLRGLLKNGFIRYNAIGSIIELQYVKNNNLFEKIEMSLRINNNFTTTSGREETMYLVTDFVLDCYYYFEWDQKPVDINTLSKILNIQEASVSLMLKKIRKELFILGHDVLNG